MYCKNCGKEIADSSKFCSFCGQLIESERSAPVSDPSAESFKAASVQAGAEAHTGTGRNEADEDIFSRKPIFDEFHWNVDEYPGRRTGKTEDVNFDWNARPQDIPDPVYERMNAGYGDASAERKTAEQIRSVQNADTKTKTEARAAAEASAAETYRAAAEASPVTGLTENAADEQEPLSAADRIDKFYTFNKKNEEFQQLLNREYEKVKSGNPIGHEMSEAEKAADRRFAAQPKDSSMEAFLEKEGIVKPYQPKAFQSDVLQRIEAQEAAKEAKRLEEEARLAAIEEARKEAEAEAKRKAEEEARIAAEAEAKRKAEEEAARLAEIARRNAEEQAKREEEARRKAAEEARLRAEEEARRAAEEEARRKAEAEAKVKAAEEARLKAEADLRAAQEAAKIKAQQEARMAAEAEARFRAQQEKRQLEAIEAQRRLEAKRQKIAAEANQAVAQEEIRRVIEQTTRMRDEEAAKIRATVSAMRDGIDQIKENAANREIAEAHQATRNQIDEMTKARQSFFADLKEADSKPAEASAPVQETPETTYASAAQPASAHVSAAQPQAEQAQFTAPQTGYAEQAQTAGNDMFSEEEFFHTRAVDKSAIMAGLTEQTRIANKETTAAPASDEEFFNSLDAAAAASQPKEAQPQTMQPKEAQPIDFRDETESAPAAESADDLLSQFENINADDLQDIEQQIEQTQKYGQQFAKDMAQQAAAEQLRMSDTIHAGNLGAQFRTEQAAAGDTVVMPHSESFSQIAAANDFDNYGNEEAANYINQQHQAQQNAAAAGMDEFYGDGFYDEEDESQLSKKELRRRAKEQKKLEREKAKEAKILAKRDADFDNEYTEEADDSQEKGGAGRLVLKIILVVLIVILAVEVIGMGIRFIAPQSKAAEFIDNQLNKVIHLITGEAADGGQADGTVYSAGTLQITVADPAGDTQAEI